VERTLKEKEAIPLREGKKKYILSINYHIGKSKRYLTRFDLLYCNAGITTLIWMATIWTQIKMQTIATSQEMTVIQLNRRMKQWGTTSVSSSKYSK